MPIGWKHRNQTLAFIKSVCKELEQPFTILDLVGELHERRKIHPTVREIAAILPHQAFVEIVGKKRLGNGHYAKEYIYVEVEK